MSRIGVLSRRLARLRQALEPPEIECTGARQELIDKLMMHMTPEQRAQVRIREPHELDEETRAHFAGLRQMLAESVRAGATYRTRR